MRNLVPWPGIEPGPPTLGSLSSEIFGVDFDSHWEIKNHMWYLMEVRGASLVDQKAKNLCATQGTQVQSLGWEIPWRRKWPLTPVFLPGESHGQRSLVGYSPWTCKESDTTERLTLSLSRGSVLKILCVRPLVMNLQWRGFLNATWIRK